MHARLSSTHVFAVVASLTVSLTALGAFSRSTLAGISSRATVRSSALGYSALERAYVAKELAAGRTQVAVWLAAHDGKVSEAVGKLASLGADVVLVEKDIDFVIASVPIARLIELPVWPEVSAVQIASNQNDLLRSVQSGAANRSTQPAKPGAPPTVYTPRDNPYTGESATESLQFKAAHPSYDGRGATVGSIEPLDPRTPSLANAMTLDGKSIPKLNYRLMPPLHVNVEPIPGIDDFQVLSWQQTLLVTPDVHGSVTFNGQRYKLPAPPPVGELRMAMVRRGRQGPASELTLLWAVQSGRVWICHKGQVDLAAATVVTALPEAPLRAAIATVEPHDPAQQLGNAIVVAVDTANKTIGVQTSAGTHGSMCASVATGHSFLNSLAEGVAPAASFFSVLGYRSIDFDRRQDLPTQMRPLFAILREPRVDVVTMSGVTPSNARRRVGDEDSAYALAVHRLLEQSGKPIFWSAGNNGPDLDFDTAPVNGRDAIAVGGYTPQETWEANFGITPTNPHTPAPYSAFGPSYDGALKPDLLALTGTLAAAPLDAPTAGLSPFYERPSGAFLSGGTSAAAPHAAGHAALLVSAAKQAGIPYDSDRLKMALYSTTKFLDGVEARVQGRGLIQVAQAWEALRRIKDYTPLRFRTEAPVKTAYSGELTKPGVGQGLYERIGWTLGQSGDRLITIVRISGPARPIPYTLRWRGDPAFSSTQRTVPLPLNVPVTVPVHIKVNDSRAYSAILDFIDPAVDLVAHSVLLTVMVGEPLSAANGYTATVTRWAPRPGHGFVFVDVPEGATALRVRVKQTHGKNMALRAQMPNGQTPRVALHRMWYGQPLYDPWAKWYLSSSDRETYDQTFVRPPAGVWQLWMEHDGGTTPRSYDPTESRPARAIEFTLEATAIGVESVPGTSDDLKERGVVSFTNRFAAIPKAQVKPLGLSAEREDEPVVKPGLAPVFYDIDIEPGTTQFVASIDGVDTKANLSLLVFRMTGDESTPVEVVAAQILGGAHKQVKLAHLPPGKYKVAIDAWGQVPAEGVRVRYRDRITHPMYGRVAVTDEAGELRAGATRTARITVDTQAAPVNGRTLVAEVGLFCEGCAYMRNEPPIPNPTRPGTGTLSKVIVFEPVPVATATVPLARVATRWGQR